MSTPKFFSSSTKSKFSIHPAFPLVWAVLLILGKSDGVLLVFIAAAVHEIAHIVAFAACGERIEKIRLLPFGISVSLCSVTDVSCVKEIVAALAGIVANTVFGFAALAVGKTENVLGSEFFAACNFALAAVNLFPVLPLDGGRALYFLLLTRHSPRRAHIVTVVVSFVFLVPLTVLAVLLVIKTGYNFSLLMICVYLFSYIALNKDF